MAEVTWATHESTKKLRRLYTRYLKRLWGWQDRVDRIESMSEVERRLRAESLQRMRSWSHTYRMRVRDIQAELDSRGESR